MRLFGGVLTLLFCLSASIASAAPDVPTGPLPRDVVPTLVQLDLRLDPRQPRFTGQVRIQARVDVPTRVVWMHGLDLEITRAEALLADGRRLPLQAGQVHESGVLRLDAAEPLPAGPLVLELDYGAAFGALSGAYRTQQDGRDYVLTQMEPLGARKAFPGFDEPSFKQPWEVSLQVPADAVAVANAPALASDPLAEGWKRVRFARTEALPSYLIAFAVGPWEVIDGPAIAAHGHRADPIPFRTLAAQGQHARVAWGHANTAPIVHALEDYFGTPYPFAKLDNLAAPAFFGAMENAGLVYYQDALLMADADSPVRERLSFWMVSAHELAHQWFGNLVTLRWWDDLWLNEAFANWMGYKIAHQLQPDLGADRAMLQAVLKAMADDGLASTRRIGEPIVSYTDIESAFDSITYEKGGAVLAMVENAIGEEAFRDGVRDYLAANARGNATRDQLFAAIAKRSAEPDAVLATLSDFVGQPGVPLLEVDLDCSGRTPTLALRQRRSLPVGSTADARQSWTLPVCARYRDGDQVRRECAFVAGEAPRLPLRDARQCPAWVMPNADARGYYRYALAPRWQAALTRSFDQLDGREQQAYADALGAGFHAGTLAKADYLAALPQLAAGVSQVATAPFADLRWISEHLMADQAARQAFHVEVAAAYRPRMQALGLVSRADDDDDRRALRRALAWFMAGDLRDPQTRAPLAVRGDALLRAGDGAGADGAGRDLRAAALAVAVQEGGVAAFDRAEARLRASQDPVLRGELLAAMGLADDPALQERARALLLDATATRASEMQILGRQVGMAAMRPGLRAWLRAHQAALVARVGPMAMLGELMADAAGACDAASADALQARYGDRVASIEGGPRALAQNIEDVRLCAALKAAQSASPGRASR